ncbi:Calcineurin-like phosphoesterase [Rhizobium leguminosarum bv. trifolii WSM2297]|uniref:Calcineurin-like phosphoesterase n=1 Tax=Rhizobium leguminosarum bv. trifolii WSM2297 TaxID=754762 RepID=J0W4K0_RHILT|nr:metallophosphoesterase [Rhizobium leguminosarum]EJC80661.1 Calcineurin-like phosphoesterase [Rhizobium leguminosarum bv. trifolii WSM2297]
MKAWIISDLHSSPLDLLHRRELVVPKAEICICAGDIAGNIEHAIDFLHAEIAPHMPVVATLGNHDYYGSSIDRSLEYARKWTAGTNVHILENNTFHRDDLRIVGATLWTDFEIDAHDFGHLPAQARRDLAARECMRYLLDFRMIHRSDARNGDDSGFITPDEMISRHLESRAYIEQELAKPFDGTTMVLTHHAISPRSLDPRFTGHISNAAFASDLSGVIYAERPHFWVHGHIHRFADYVEGGTRLLCNPRGYLGELGGSGFRPGYVVEAGVPESMETKDD